MRKKGDNCKEQGKSRGESTHTSKTPLSQWKKRNYKTELHFGISAILQNPNT